MVACRFSIPMGKQSDAKLERITKTQQVCSLSQQITGTQVCVTEIESSFASLLCTHTHLSLSRVHAVLA